MRKQVNFLKALVSGVVAGIVVGGLFIVLQAWAVWMLGCSAPGLRFDSRTIG